MAALAGVTALAWWQSGEGLTGTGSFDRRFGSRPANSVMRSAGIVDDGKTGPLWIPKLVGGLTAADPHIRRDAVLTLVGAGEAARPFLPALRSRLGDTDPQVRGQAATALGRIDHASPRTAAELARLLGDPNMNVRSASSAALSDMGPTALPVVLSLLEHADPVVRLQVVQILQRHRRHSAEVTAALRRAAEDSSPPVREVAVVSLLLEQQVEIADVVRYIHDSNANISDTAVANLPWFGTAAVVALPDLIARLESPLPRQLSWLLFALRSLNHEAAPAIPALLRLLDSPVAYDIAEILETLIDVGAEPPVMSPLLVRCLYDESPRVAGRAARLLSQIDPTVAGRQALRLADLLDSRSGETVALALAGLRGLGALAVDAVPHLVRTLSDADADTKEQVAKVLVRIGPPAAPATPAIVAQMQQTFYGTRTMLALIEAAGAIGPEAAPALPILMEMIRSAEVDAPGTRSGPSVDRARCAALVAIANIGGRDPDFLDVAQAALSSDSMSMRIAALQALSIVGTPARDRLPDILPALEYGDSNIRLAAAQTINNASDGNPQLISTLVRLLEDADLEVRAAAAAALGRLGPSAADAVPALYATRGFRDNYFPLSSLPSRNRSIPVYLAQNQNSCFSVAQAVEQALRQIVPETASAAR